MSSVKPVNAALDYLGRGWSVIPLRPRDKRPLQPWQELQERLPRPSEVRQWFAGEEALNVGVVTGKVSGLVVLDVDEAHGGPQSLARLEEAHGRLPPTIEAATGGGGRHLYFTHPGEEVPNQVGLAPGLDLRGDGGYVVAPPSRHPTGRRYAWKPGHAPGERELAPLSGWLRHRLTHGEAGRRGHPPAYWRSLVQEGVATGARNSTIASLSGHLLWRGVDPDVVLELMLCWNRVRCRPPLSDEEVARTVGSITRTHQRAGD